MRKLHVRMCLTSVRRQRAAQHASLRARHLSSVRQEFVVVMKIVRMWRRLLLPQPFQLHHSLRMATLPTMTKFHLNASRRWSHFQPASHKMLAFANRVAQILRLMMMQTTHFLAVLLRRNVNERRAAQAALHRARLSLRARRTLEVVQRAVLVRQRQHNLLHHHQTHPPSLLRIQLHPRPADRPPSRHLSPDCLPSL